ncbi:MAG TPA: RNA polymerase sigma factor [Egibacteraceae bacterium]|nr:RNA polymerase sigma factor [Egibacteraceae bacterium]
MRDRGFREHVVPELDVLLRVARRLTGSPDSAEDLVQETLIRAYRAVDRFDGRHPRAWLLTILRNTWKNMNRRARPLFADDPDEALNRAPARGADGRTGAEEQVVDAGFDQRLAQALTDLALIHQEVVVLVDMDGLSYQETADVLGVAYRALVASLARLSPPVESERLERLRAFADELAGAA